MRRWWVVLVVVATAACGGDSTPRARPSAAGDPTAAFPDADELPPISTTTTQPPHDGVQPAMEGPGRLGSPTTFGGVPSRTPKVSSTTTAPASAGADSPYELVANLSGAEAVPAPGDPRGTGRAVVREAGTGICVDVEVRSLFAEPTAAHLHRGTRGVAGEVVAALPVPENGGSASGCVALDAATVDALGAEPGRFYVDVHTGTHPDGAVRGQLAA